MSLDRFEGRELSGNNELPEGISALLSAYRSALPDVEPSPHFTPGIWSKIDIRRRESRWFGRIARGFVTASGAICLMLSAAMWVPGTQVSPVYTSSYIDVLANDVGPDEAIETDPVRSDSL